MSDFEEWRAAVQQGLKGAPFESLSAATLEGIPVQPLYTERDHPGSEGIPWAPREPRALGPVIDDPGAIAEAVAGGASLVWLAASAAEPGPFDRGASIDLVIDCKLAPGRVSLAGGRVRALADPSHLGGEREAVLAEIARALDRGAAALGVDATVEDRQGSDAVVQIAQVAASMVASLRAIEARGVSLERAVEGTTIAVAVGPGFFGEIAKLRALRRVVARICGAIGIDTRPWIVARTSERMRAALDTPNNVLRNTLAVSAALIGGADAVACDPHEPGGRALRLARTLPLVLALEARLDAVSDPAAGSFYIEHRTAALARAAWDLFTEAERGGGALEARCAASRNEREAWFQTRRIPIVGVSRFPVPAERALSWPGPRDAEPFERLRAAAVPEARVVVLAGCPEARVEFAREIAQLAADRVEVCNELGAGEASIVVLCAPDAEMGSGAVEAARALRGSGAKAIAVAGKPGPHEARLREAGVDAFLHVGVDLVCALALLQARAGGEE